MNELLLLPWIWFIIIAFEICLYILLDGADLGIGMLSMFQKGEDKRAIMMHVIGPIWDANETWLVVAGGTLFGAFPQAYGVMLSALYIPVMMLIFGIIIRAVSFEFHEYGTNKHFWSFLFGVGSFVSVMGQGFMAGGLYSGITVVDGQFAGGMFDWVSPFPVIMTIALIFGYLIVGYAYLLHKRENVHGWLRWLYPISLVTMALGFAAATLYMMPYIVPPSLTIFDAASSPVTLKFMLYGIGPLIPIVLAYNFYLYRVFKDEREESRVSGYGA